MFRHMKQMVYLLAVVLLLTTSRIWAADLTGAGATFPYPLYSKWFDAYGKITGVRINYQSVGSGAGIQQLKAGTVDFGASDAPLSDDEMRSMPGPVIHIPTVAGAVALTYNTKSTGTSLRLTPEIISGIFLGKVRRWNDPEIQRVNPTLRLPDQAIYVVHRSDGSGTTFIFTHYLSAISSEWRSKVGAGKSVSWPTGIGGKGNEGVSGIVKQTPGAIGYVELAYAVQNKLPYAQVRNRAGHFVAPSLRSTVAAANGSIGAMKRDIRSLIVNSPVKDAYPIAGFTYILLYRNQTDTEKARELCKFLKWAMRDGQKMAEPLMYAPLPSRLIKINLTAIASVKANGGPVAD